MKGMVSPTFPAKLLFRRNAFSDGLITNRKSLTYFLDAISREHKPVAQDCSRAKLFWKMVILMDERGHTSTAEPLPTARLVDAIAVTDAALVSNFLISFFLNVLLALS
jgi:hypothetical protein